MQYTYTNADTLIFEGFYESALYNSDTEHNFNCGLEEEYELKDFDGFRKAVGEAATNLLRPMLERDGFVSDVKFEGIKSPREYNFTTDSLLISMDIDFDALKAWVLETEERCNGFDRYLTVNYSNRPGFVSFVGNDLDRYFERSYDRYQDVLIDYYLLTEICGSERVTEDIDLDCDYRLNLIESADDALHEFMIPTEETETT